MQPLGAFDSLHIAVAVEDVWGALAGEDLAFVTRDRRQGAAARALGFDVR